MFAQFFLYQPLEVFENKCLYCIELFGSLYIIVVMNPGMFDLEVGIVFFLMVITVFVVGCVLLHILITDFFCNGIQGN